MYAHYSTSLPNPAAAGWKVICDFDGTITPFDVTDAVLAKFAPPEWERIEREWLDDLISARQCMERQVALIAAPLDALEAFLDAIPLTPGFVGFCGFCRSQGLDLMVVSDGMDYPIKRILAAHGLGWIPVVANRLRVFPGGGYALEFPYGRDGCPSGVCKCGVAQAGEGGTLLIGDGRSDCCLARNAEFVMARKGKDLHRQCVKNRYPHLVWSDFYDVRMAFSAMLNAGRRHAARPAEIRVPA